MTFPFVFVIMISKEYWRWRGTTTTASKLSTNISTRHYSLFTIDYLPAGRQVHYSLFLPELVVIQKINEANRKFIPMRQVELFTEIAQVSIIAGR